MKTPQHMQLAVGTPLILWTHLTCMSGAFLLYTQNVHHKRNVNLTLQCQVQDLIRSCVIRKAFTQSDKVCVHLYTYILIHTHTKSANHQCYIITNCLKLCRSNPTAFAVWTKSHFIISMTPNASFNRLTKTTIAIRLVHMRICRVSSCTKIIKRGEELLLGLNRLSRALRAVIPL